jgi:hypothetical protein
MWRTSSLKVLPFAQKVEAGIIDWTILNAIATGNAIR